MNTAISDVCAKVTGLVVFFVSVIWNRYEYAGKMVEDRASRAFLCRDAAQAYADANVDNGAILTEEIQESALYRNSGQNPYERLDHTNAVRLGDLHNSRWQYQTTCYTSKELEAEGRLEYEKLYNAAKKASDGYYSQRWV